jgi:hypothetical protein
MQPAIHPPDGKDARHVSSLVSTHDRPRCEHRIHSFGVGPVGEPARFAGRENVGHAARLVATPFFINC